MRMPGFTAEASQFKSSRHYGLAAAFARSSLVSSVVPAKINCKGDWCGDCIKHFDGWYQNCCVDRHIEWFQCDPPPGTSGTPPPTKPSCRKICCVDGEPQLT